jgi:hypothetical protein
MITIGYNEVVCSQDLAVVSFGGHGLYWVLFNLGRVNHWFQYNHLKVFLGFFCYVGCYFVVYSYLLFE